MSQLFSYQGSQVRTVTENNQTWFAAIDVCKALGITWSGATMKPIPSEWRSMLNFNMEGKTRKTSFVTEAAVYKLAFRSNKPEADKFTNWVASEVLPAIRKTGRYSEMTEEEKRESWQGSLDALNYWYQTHPVTHKRISMDEREAIARELGIAREKVSSAPMEEPEQPRTTVAVNGMNKALKTSKDIGEAIRLVDDIYMRLRNELRPVTPRPWGNTAELRKKAEARYDLQWDMFRAATNSLHAALAALCAAAEVADMS